MGHKKDLFKVLLLSAWNNHESRYYIKYKENVCLNVYKSIYVLVNLSIVGTISAFLNIFLFHKAFRGGSSILKTLVKIFFKRSVWNDALGRRTIQLGVRGRCEPPDGVLGQSSSAFGYFALHGLKQGVLRTFEWFLITLF